MLFSFFIWSISWFYDMNITMPGNRRETPKT